MSAQEFFVIRKTFVHGESYFMNIEPDGRPSASKTDFHVIKNLDSAILELKFHEKYQPDEKFVISKLKFEYFEPPKEIRETLDLVKKLKEEHSPEMIEKIKTLL